jgi:hypothetical protein
MKFELSIGADREIVKAMPGYETEPPETILFRNVLMVGYQIIRITWDLGEKCLGKCYDVVIVEQALTESQGKELSMREARWTGSGPEGEAPVRSTLEATKRHGLASVTPSCL